MEYDSTRDTLALALKNDSYLEQVVQEAVRAAVEAHKRAGNAVADWQDGRVVLVEAKDIVLPEEDALESHAIG